MPTRTRRTAAPSFKAKVALAELAQHYDVHRNQITVWKGHLVEADSGLCGSGGAASGAIDVKTLHTKIGELTSMVVTIQTNSRWIVQLLQVWRSKPGQDASTALLLPSGGEIAARSIQEPVRGMQPKDAPTAFRGTQQDMPHCQPL